MIKIGRASLDTLAWRGGRKRLVGNGSLAVRATTGTWVLYKVTSKALWFRTTTTKTFRALRKRDLYAGGEGEIVQGDIRELDRSQIRFTTGNRYYRMVDIVASIERMGFMFVDGMRTEWSSMGDLKTGSLLVPRYKGEYEEVKPSVTKRSF